MLYECLTGRRAFGGKSMTDVLAAIVGHEPDWSALPPETPPAVRRTLRRCLAKDPKRRYHHIADVRIELAEPAGEATAAAPASPRRPGWLGVAVGVLVGVLATAS